MIVALFCAAPCTEPRGSPGGPPEARVVVESDPHPLGCERRRCGDSGKDGQSDDEADDASHERSPNEGGGRVGEKLRAP